ncbi:MAG TPA: Fur family transcriptional regulator [Candidatus Xenobia bacterium]|jgi:Fur family ferric uptake transcriptional regulator
MEEVAVDSLALAARLRDSGLRLTPQRAVILEVVAGRGDHRHLTVQEVFLDARDRLPGLNAATVYRTLEALHDAGLVDMMAVGSDVVRFSLHDPRQRHGHLVCRGCGSVEQLDYARVHDLSQHVLTQHGFLLDAAHLTLSGLCQKCRRGAGEHSE